MGPHRALRPRCATCPPDGQGNRGNYCVPRNRTAQILTQPKNSDDSMFHTENAKLLSKSAVFALRTYASPVVGGLQGGHGKPDLLMGAVRALCRTAPNHQETVFFGFVEGAIGCGHSCRTGQNPQHFEEFGHAVALCPFLQ